MILAQRTQSPPSEVVNNAVEAALQLVRDLQEDKLALAKQVVSTLAVWQVDLEASQCTAVENGNMGAESLWDGGYGARRRERELLKQHNAEVEAGV